MKIIAGFLAATLLATPALAQSGDAATQTPPAAGDDQGKPPATGEDQGKPPADSTPPGDDEAAAKPVAPEPEQAPEGTTPVKPADTPTR